MQPLTKLIAITPGEPAGVGPDITVKLIQKKLPSIPVVVADPDLLLQRAKYLRLPIKLTEFKLDDIHAPHEPGQLYIVPVKLHAQVKPGQPGINNAQYLLETLKIAVEYCMDKKLHALVTGPVNKAIINEAGISFSGHTEFLGQLTHARPVMMLIADTLRVALATTHLPLSAVSKAINKKDLQSTIEILYQDLQSKFAIKAPTIAVTGLNPHAGESGHLGDEEITIIEPTINKLRDAGMSLLGPLPADSTFTPEILKKCDAVLAMYHDQGLPVLKYIGFGNAVNVTLGLPIIRTSVDHGTAFDIAGSGQANADSLAAAFQQASEMSLHS